MLYDKGTLQEKARKAREYTLAMIHAAGSGHPGGSLSAIDLLCSIYFNQLRGRPDDPDRDRFILSKGHACPALYAVGALIGLTPLSALAGFRKLNSPFQGHPHVGALPWVETSTGSLGQGFSVAIGMALGQRYKKKDSRVHVMLGDGEMQEGEIWEGAMFETHHRLKNLCAILDYNKMQSDDLNSNIMNLEPLADKWRAFGWHVLEIDGHDFAAIENAFKAFQGEPERPTFIIAHTIKGRGVSYMEGIPTWHGSVKMTDENLKIALADLGLNEPETAAWLNGSAWEVLS